MLTTSRALNKKGSRSDTQQHDIQHDIQHDNHKHRKTNHSDWFVEEYTELAAGIVIRAVKDYVKIIQKPWCKKLTLAEKRKLVAAKLEIEEFFYSQWFEFLSDLDPDKILQNCRRKAIEDEKEKIKKQNAKKLKRKLEMECEI